MKKITTYRNNDIKRVIAFIPPGHRHVRLLIETDDCIMIFQEATVSAIIRAYVNVALHPLNKAVELTLRELKDRKEGFAKYQQIESEKSEGEVINEVMNILG